MCLEKTILFTLLGISFGSVEFFSHYLLCYVI